MCTAILRPPNILHATARAGMVCVRHVRVFAAAPPPQRTLN